MKDHLRDIYDIADENHWFTAADNIRTPSRKQMIEWLLGAWIMLLDELILKSFKIWAWNGSLDGPDDDKTVCIKYGPRKDLLVHLRILEDTDPFGGIPEDEVCL